MICEAYTRDLMMMQFYRIEMINDETGKKRFMFVQALNNPRHSLVKIDDMRVFWCVQLTFEQYEKQKKEWQHD